MIRKFFDWFNNPEDLPGFITRILIAILISTALTLTFSRLVFLTLLSL